MSIHTWKFYWVTSLSPSSTLRKWHWCVELFKQNFWCPVLPPCGARWPLHMCLPTLQILCFAHSLHVQTHLCVQVYFALITIQYSCLRTFYSHQDFPFNFYFFLLFWKWLVQCQPYNWSCTTETDLLSLFKMTFQTVYLSVITLTLPHQLPHSTLQTQLRLSIS